jgi:beta-barrel assembly-enhancing protease
MKECKGFLALGLTLVLCFNLAEAQTASSADTAPATKPIKAYHDGSIRDLEAIGNRNVGCNRGIGNWYSVEGQIRMGKEYAQQVESSSKLIKDPVISEYINRVGQNLVRNSDSQVPFAIKVLDSDDVNAFALPGGFFFVNSGLILAADNEAELAGVMAHEIAHVAACHIARENTRGQLFNLASIPLIFVGGGVGYAVRNIAGIGMPMTFLKFSRGFESEADFLGVEYLYKAGYDPQAFTAFFEKVQALEKKKPGTIAKAFDTHPQTPDRLAKSQQEIQTLLPNEAQYKLDTSEFQDVKARLGRLENRRKIEDSKENRPTLRRSTSTESSDSGKDNSGADDRPTLKRRDGTNPD